MTACPVTGMPELLVIDAVIVIGTSSAVKSLVLENSISYVQVKRWTTFRSDSSAALQAVAWYVAPVNGGPKPMAGAGLGFVLVNVAAAMPNSVAEKPSTIT